MERLARAIVMAAGIREASYDVEGAQKAVDSGIFTDYTKFYGKTIEEAADEAADGVGLDQTRTPPVYLLLKNCWNEALEWAEAVIKNEESI